MKILHVVPTYFPARRYGGPIEAVHALNKHLVRQGCEVTVYTTAIDGEEDLDVPLNVPVDLDGVKVYYFSPGLFRSWFYSGHMRRALREHIADFDLAHITSVFLAASTLGARAARRSNKPYIIAPNGSLMRAPLARKSASKKRFYLKFVENKNLASASAIHFATEAELADYQAAGLPLRQPLVISNGLDTGSLPPGDAAAFRSRYGIQNSKKLVLFLGRISWVKGLDTLIEGFASLAKEMPEAVLVVAGGDDESYRSQLEAGILEYGLTGKVIFTGELHGKDRSSAYEAADVFVLPSYSENFGMVVAEAMYFGVPVVVTEEVGISAWVKEAESGFVIKKDPLQLKFALYKILSSSTLGRKMGESGRQLVSQEFSYEAVAERFIEAYSRLIRP